MYKLSDSSGPVGYGETSWEAGNVTEASGKNEYKALIAKANSVPLTRIFAHYNLKLDQYNRKAICPFKDHKGGRESSPSFYYNAEKNSFRCYGCGAGSPFAHSVEFMSAMDGISKSKAADKIIKLFGVDTGSEVIFDKEDFSEKLQIMLNFSNDIREFRQMNIDIKSQAFIENICKVYDAMNAKHDLNGEALGVLIGKLKAQISLYELSNL